MAPTILYDKRHNNILSVQQSYLNLALEPLSKESLTQDQKAALSARVGALANALEATCMDKIVEGTDIRGKQNEAHYRVGSAAIKTIEACCLAHNTLTPPDILKILAACDKTIYEKPLEPVESDFEDIPALSGEGFLESVTRDLASLGRNPPALENALEQHKTVRAAYYASDLQKALTAPVITQDEKGQFQATFYSVTSSTQKILENSLKEGITPSFSAILESCQKDSYSGATLEAVQRAIAMRGAGESLTSAQENLIDQQAAAFRDVKNELLSPQSKTPSPPSSNASEAGLSSTASTPRSRRSSSPTTPTGSFRGSLSSFRETLPATLTKIETSEPPTSTNNETKPHS